MKKTLVLPAVRVSRSGSLAPAHSNTNLPLVKHSIVLVGLLKHAQPRRGWLRAVLALAAPLALAVPAAAERHDFLDRPSYQPSSRELSVADMPRHKTKRQARAAKDEQPVPQGPLHIIVSIAKQRVTAYANGTLVGRAPISTGMPDHPTPMGVFTVISKSRWHVSNIYSGAPMPYMQRITWSGIALHAGKLPGYPASHGCIRLPEHFAARLWGLSKIGARVIVARDEVAPVAIVHPRLPVPKKPQNKPADALAAAPPAAGKIELVASVGNASNVGDDMKEIGAIKPAPPEDIVQVMPRPQRQGPVQVFVSRKQGKVFVRQDFKPIFEAPVTITEPERPLGTHVFTAMQIQEDGAAMQWTAVTIPTGYGRTRDRDGKRDTKLVTAPTAAAALDRIEMPEAAIDRIAGSLAVGSALIVSDNALSDETGLETDFIVLTK
ncbi:MAG: L,D-transpeptidase [Pseudolabrys sp.]|jgi:lipoprotein-anchoring transpeptidase ErfK/SrfK